MNSGQTQNSLALFLWFSLFILLGNQHRSQAALALPARLADHPRRGRT
jgi:hypothetical protein